GDGGWTRVGRSGDAIFAARDLFAGGTSIVDRASQLTADDKLAAIAAIGRCLDTAHKAGVPHGRGRPENVWLNGAGTWILTDYGLCAPHGDERDDQHALGRLAYWLLTGASWTYAGTHGVEVLPGAAAVNEALSRALSTDRRRRFRHIDEFVVAFA